MKTTRYFEFTRQRPDRSAIQNPVEERVQSDGRIRKWTWVEKEGKFLRVILLSDGETVHNAFFDRTFRTGD